MRRSVRWNYWRGGTTGSSHRSTYTYVHTHPCLPACMHTYTDTYLHTYTHTYVYMYILCMHFIIRMYYTYLPISQGSMAGLPTAPWPSTRSHLVSLHVQGGYFGIKDLPPFHPDRRTEYLAPGSELLDIRNIYKETRMKQCIKCVFP